MFALARSSKQRLALMAALLVIASHHGRLVAEPIPRNQRGQRVSQAADQEGYQRRVGARRRVKPLRRVAKPRDVRSSHQVDYVEMSHASDIDWIDSDDCTACGATTCYECCQPCGIQAQFEALLWWMSDNDLPYLVTTNSVIPEREDAGVIGHDTTVNLYGNSGVNGDVRGGGRLTVAWQPFPCSQDAIELQWFSIASESSGFDDGSDGDPVLARPFFDVTTGESSSELVAYPDVLSGSIAVSTANEAHSVRIVRRFRPWCHCGPRWDFLIGYRYFRFREGLSIREDLTSTDPGGLVEQGTRIEVMDQFTSRNDFHGVQLGIARDFLRSCWSANVFAGIAIGGVRERLSISGNTVVTTPGESSVASTGGLLALPTNIVEHTETQFAVLPELNVNLGFQLTCRTRLLAGYSVLVISDVLRTGSSIDTSVNPTQLPAARGGTGVLAGEPRPQPRLGGEALWLHGINLGVEWRR